MSSPLLDLQNISAGYGDKKVISDITFSLSRGEILAVVGESGCGKSTMLKAITGLAATGVSVSAGSIIFEDRNVLMMKGEERRHMLGSEMCIVFQNPSTTLNPIRQIRKQFLETIRSHKNIEKKEALAIIVAAFEKLGLENPERILESCPFELSIGMCQRVCLALAMVMEPKLILADEVTSALDVVSQRQIMKEFLLLRESYGSSIILVTHNIILAEQIADKTAIMLDGHIVEYGKTEQVLTMPEHSYTQSLIADAQRLPTEFTSREFPKVLLEADKISRRYSGKGGEVTALDNISFNLRKGEILGVVGESGNGKSTLARLLLFLESPNSGEICLEGIPLSALRQKDSRELYRRGQMVFQNPVSSFAPRQSIRSSIRDTLKNLTDIKNTKEADVRIDELMELVGLESQMADRYPFQLSGGQCQRAAIARAVAVNPEFIICDETTSALDVTTQAQIIKLLCSLVQRFEMSMVFISHDIALVGSICDRILVMKDGKCVECGDVGSVIMNPNSEYTKMLLEPASD